MRHVPIHIGKSGLSLIKEFIKAESQNELAFHGRMSGLIIIAVHASSYAVHMCAHSLYMSLNYCLCIYMSGMRVRPQKQTSKLASKDAGNHSMM